MDYKNCEEYILSEYFRLSDLAEDLKQSLNYSTKECKNLNDVITFLRNIIKVELIDDKLEFKFSDDINTDTPQGKFYRDALMGLFGPNQVPLNPVEPEVKPEN